MIDATVGSVVINEMLPSDMRDYDRVLNKSTLNKLLTQLARRYPEKYKEMTHQMLLFSSDAAYTTGGQSFKLDDIQESKAAKQVRKQIEAETQAICRKYYRQGIPLNDPKVQKEIVANAGKHREALVNAVIKEKGDTTFFRQLEVMGGGKKGAYNSVVGADLLYEDQDSNPVPFPVLHSYSHGLTPAEYFAGSFGARKGVVDLQNATADSGFLAKQLVQIAHREVVTADDDPNPYDDKHPVGYPVEVDDPDNEGAYLAHPVAGYPRNTLLTSKILKDIKDKGNKNILVRSTTVGGSADGGIYGYDAGIRELGRRPAPGEFVGISAVQSVSEPLTQGAISCLHPGTRVRMGDGSSKCLRDIVVGDEVLGSSYHGDLTPVKVTRIFDQGLQPVYLTQFRDRSIACTLEHKILQYQGGRPVVRPIGADPIAVVTEDGYLRLKRVSDQFYIGSIPTLDIEVDSEDHLFVLANGLIVSNSKHSGGVVGAGSAKAISGFAYVNQLIQVPKHFKNGATHATLDGRVTGIEDAPQGGQYIIVGDTRHYVAPQHGENVPIHVKVGDSVEAGDALTDGIPNPSMIVKYKGLGEGRRVFVNQFRESLKSSGQSINRRNLEALSRGLMSYVKMTEELGNASPDDILPYSMVAANYKPREGFTEGDPKKLVGCYLEKPILHYTIGTKVQPSMVKMMNDYGVKSICCHKDPPPFEPEMVRGMAHASKDPDWGTKLIGSYNKNSILESARLGATSFTEGTSYVPALAFGGVDFGRKGAIVPPEKRKYL